MGFGHCRYNPKTLASELGVSEDAVKDALKKSRIGGFARVFGFDDKSNDKANFGNCRISISRKLENGEWEPNFQDGYVAFFGEAYSKISKVVIPEAGVPIVITNSDVTNNYNKETKKLYTNFAVYDFDFYVSDYTSAPTMKESANTKTNKAKPKTDNEGFTEIEDENDLPF